MPTYEYKCRSCCDIQEVTHSIKEDPEILCTVCGSKEPAERLISFNRGGFILKGGTEAIHWKEKRERMKKRSELGVKQIDRYGTDGGTRLQPNVAGMEVDSWKDASKLAKEAGMSTESYTPLIEKEKNVGKAGVDDRVWKAAKEEKNKA
jgi:putative FmdB family regulatory protein